MTSQNEPRAFVLPPRPCSSGRTEPISKHRRSRRTQEATIMAMSLGKLIGCVLVMWLLVVLMISGPLFHSGEPDEQVLARLTRAVSELETLKQQNEELRSLLNAIKEPSRKEEAKELKEPKEPVIQQTGCGEPSQEYEVRRRRAADGVQELWFYARAQLKKLLPNLKQEDKATLQRIIDDLAEHRRAIQLDLEEMRRADGHDAWRQAESRALSNLVRSRLSQLQHPADCGQAPKLVCSLNKGCGYGCQVHHATYCLITAYATRRTLVLHSKGWRYSSAGWESVFLPVSNSCTEAPSGVPWSANVANAPVVELPIIDNVQPRPAFLPLSRARGPCGEDNAAARPARVVVGVAGAGIPAAAAAQPAELLRQGCA
ncbi:hypothetical protein MTO96_028483 [Rhipicephalus appendiculatus]